MPFNHRNVSLVIIDNCKIRKLELLTYEGILVPKQLLKACFIEYTVKYILAIKFLLEMHPQKGPQLLTLAEMLNFWFQTNVGINTGSWSHHHANAKDALEIGSPQSCLHPRKTTQGCAYVCHPPEEKTNFLNTCQCQVLISPQERTIKGENRLDLFYLNNKQNYSKHC